VPGDAAQRGFTGIIGMGAHLAKGNHLAVFETRRDIILDWIEDEL
jgi:hypothetical protein